MSRFKQFVGAVALTVMTGMLVAMSPSVAQADGEWNPSPPVVQDKCGKKYDMYMLLEERNTYHVDSRGEYLPQGSWLPTGGVSSVTVYARNFVDPDIPFTLTFGTEPDSSCVEAVDTVTTRIVECVPKKYLDGTRVQFTYTNTDDATDRTHKPCRGGSSVGQRCVRLH